MSSKFKWHQIYCKEAVFIELSFCLRWILGAKLSVTSHIMSLSVQKFHGKLKMIAGFPDKVLWVERRTEDAATKPNGVEPKIFGVWNKCLNEHSKRRWMCEWIPSYLHLASSLLPTSSPKWYPTLFGVVLLTSIQIQKKACCLGWWGWPHAPAPSWATTMPHWHWGPFTSHDGPWRPAYAVMDRSGILRMILRFYSAGPPYLGDPELNRAA